MSDSEKITIMALGGAGCRILRQFTLLDSSDKFRLLAVDSDVESLQASGVPEENWIQAGRALRSGKGCGGDVISGQQVLANERRVLHHVLTGTKVLIIVAGLGGGLASGGLPVILGVAAKLHITTTVLATLPFAMEGFQRRQLADGKVKNDILPLADAVVALPNDLLFSTLEAETPIAEAFEKSDKELAKTLFALSAILGGANLFNADFAAFTGVLKRRHSLCARLWWTTAKMPLLKRWIRCFRRRCSAVRKVWITPMRWRFRCSAVRNFLWAVPEQCLICVRVRSIRIWKKDC